MSVSDHTTLFYMIEDIWKCYKSKPYQEVVRPPEFNNFIIIATNL